jgi:hypothetical protein
LTEFNDIKNKFFTEILGLIAYDTNRPGIPFATTANDWAIIGLSSGAQWTCSALNQHIQIMNLYNSNPKDMN